MASLHLEEAVTRLEKDPKFVRRRSIMVAMFATRLLAMGIEMSVILPSVWLYIQPMGATPFFMGLVECAYAVGSMIAFPIVGLLYDQTKRAKLIILVLNTCQIAGNLLYAIPASKWCPLFGRLLAGFGDSFSACYLGELTYTFTPKKRIGVISIIGSGRVLGFMIGPALNFAIEKVSFKMGVWSLDGRNFAGFLMAIIWCLFQIGCALSALELALTVIEEACGPSSFVEAGEEENLSSDEDVSLFRSEEKCRPVPSSIPKPNFFDVLCELCSVEFLILLSIDCVLWVPQQAYSVLFPLITEKEYHWSASMAGLLYLAGGLEIVLILLCVYFLGHRFPVRDTVVLRISVLFMAASMVGLVLESVLGPHPLRVGMLMICFALLTAATSLSLIASKALITKTIKPEWQGMAHGTYSSFIRLAFICGPLVGGLAYYDRRIYGSAMFSCLAVALVLLELVKGRFHRRQDRLEQG